MSPLWTTLMMTAWAQSAPQINVQNLHVSVDDAGLWATDVADHLEGQRASARLLFGYAHRPLEVETPDGRTPYLAHLGHADLAGGYQLGPIRLGAHVPFFVAGGGETATTGGLGDTSFDLRGTVLSRARFPVSLALAARVTAPTSTMRDAALGAGGVGWEASVILDGHVGPVLLAGNLGVEGAPMRTLEEMRWGEKAFMRLGARVDVTDMVALGIEGDVALSLRGLASGYGVPAELLVSTRIDTQRGVRVQAGAGVGISRGIGTPVGRALLGIAYGRPHRGPDAHDVVDAADRCLDVTGDADGDGCPDVEVPTLVTWLDPDRAPLAAVDIRVDGEPRPAGEPWLLTPGVHEVRGSAEGFVPWEGVLEVPDSGRLDVERMLQPVSGPGEMVVAVVGLGGDDVEATVVCDEQLVVTEGGIARFTVPSGEHLVDVMAEGYGTLRLRAAVEGGGVHQITALVQAPRVAIGQGRLELRERIYFAYDSARVLPESMPILGEVASLLLAHEELEHVEIRGHTDQRGDADYNRDLSRRRAEAVVRHLAALGVDAERLSTVGVGEDEPRSPRDDEAGWALNRRVEMLVR